MAHEHIRERIEGHDRAAEVARHQMREIATELVPLVARACQSWVEERAEQLFVATEGSASGYSRRVGPEQVAALKSAVKGLVAELPSLVDRALNVPDDTGAVWLHHVSETDLHRPDALEAFHLSTHNGRALPSALQSPLSRILDRLGAVLAENKLLPPELGVSTPWHRAPARVPPGESAHWSYTEEILWPTEVVTIFNRYKAAGARLLSAWAAKRSAQEELRRAEAKDLWRQP